MCWITAGATVIGTARPGQEDEYVRGLGAVHTVGYTGDVPAAVKAIAPHGVDKIVHAAGDLAALTTILEAAARSPPRSARRPSRSAVRASPSPRSWLPRPPRSWPHYSSG